MGNIDNKRGIFNQIGALTSAKDNQNLPNPNSSISSINNTKEIVPFLLDLLVVLVGSQVLTSLVGELMTGFVRNVEPKLKTELKKQTISHNSDEPLPTSFVTSGVQIPVKDIDTYEKLKTDPSSQEGGLLFADDPNNIDKKSYDAITSAGSDVTVNNMTTNYDTVSDSFTYKPTNSSQTIGDFTNDYIDGITLINEKEFSSNVINSIFGTISTNQNKTQKQLIFEEKMNKSIQKVIDEDENIAITDDELREIELNAEKKLEGIQTVDLGCGIIDNTVTLDSLESMLSFTTGSTDPLAVGNAYSGLVGGGFDSADQQQASEDSETIKDGFFKRIINAIVNALVAALIAPPQIRILLGITSSFKNNGVAELGDPVDDLEQNRKLMDCLSKTAKSTINEFIFNIVKTEMLNLIVPVSKLILKEKINQYLGILKSLIGFS